MKKAIIIILLTFFSSTIFAQALTYEKVITTLSCKTKACFEKTIKPIKGYELFDSSATMVKYEDYGKGFMYKFTFYESDNVSEVMVSSYTKADYEGWIKTIKEKNYKLVSQKLEDVVEYYYQSDAYPDDVVVIKSAVASNGNIRYGLTLGRKHN
jgi:Na+-translocating ferredoxin:NAD+ oxidoreductase RnfG subunit